MSNAYKFAGRVVAVGKTEKMGKDPNRPFLKRTLVVDDSGPDDKYRNPVPFEATGDRCASLDAIRVGANVEVEFRLNGREWRDRAGETRYFGSNRIVDVSVSGGAEVPDLPLVTDAGTGSSDLDDMPF